MLRDIEPQAFPRTRTSVRQHPGPSRCPTRVRDSSGGDLRAEKGTAPRFSEPRPSGRGVSADAPGPLPYGLATERGSASLRARFGNTWGRRLPTSRPKCHAPARPRPSDNPPVSHARMPESLPTLTRGAGWEPRAFRVPRGVAARPGVGARNDQWAEPRACRCATPLLSATYNLPGAAGGPFLRAFSALVRI